MTRGEYEESKLQLPIFYQRLKNCKKTEVNFQKHLFNFIEALITVEGHPWCMDVKLERRKMSRLITKNVSDFF